jgi:hypothetical protein
VKQHRFHLKHRYLWFFSLIFITGVSHGTLLDSGFRAEFEVRVKGIYVGISARQLEVKGNRVEYLSTAKPGGLAKLFFSDVVTEHSSMERIGSKLKPLTYTYDQTGGKDIKHESVVFNWQQGLIKFTDGGGKEFPLSDHAYDLLNFQLALMYILQQGTKEFVLDVADYRKLYTYYSRVVGKEKVSLPYGELETIKVDSRNREDGKHFIFWCAPTLDYLPVRVEYTKKPGGTVYLTELKSLSSNQP